MAFHRDHLPDPPAAATAGRSLFDRLRLIRDRSQHRGTDLLVLLVLFSYADAKGVAFPSAETLARAARIKVRTVELALKNLRASGEVTSLRKRARNGAILRRIEFDALATKPDMSANPQPHAGCDAAPTATKPQHDADCDAPSVPANPQLDARPTRNPRAPNPQSGALPNKEKGRH